MKHRTPTSGDPFEDLDATCYDLMVAWLFMVGVLVFIVLCCVAWEIYEHCF